MIAWPAPLEPRGTVALYFHGLSGTNIAALQNRSRGNDMADHQKQAVRQPVWAALKKALTSETSARKRRGFARGAHIRGSDQNLLKPLYPRLTEDLPEEI
jgi:hypothetical protein